MVAVTESGRAIEAIEASPGDLELTTKIQCFSHFPAHRARIQKYMIFLMISLVFSSQSGNDPP